MTTGETRRRGDGRRRRRTAKATTSSGALVLRGVLGGAVLAATTSFAVSTFTVSSGSPVVGAVLFRRCTIVILVGMELVTGGFASSPHGGGARARAVVAVRSATASWWSSATSSAPPRSPLLYAGALAGLRLARAPVRSGRRPVDTAQAKTTAYAAVAQAWPRSWSRPCCATGWSPGSVLGIVSKDTIGKIAAIWLPIMAFYGLGFEHAVVNFFMIPWACSWARTSRSRATGGCGTRSPCSWATSWAGSCSRGCHCYTPAAQLALTRTTPRARLPPRPAAPRAPQPWRGPASGRASGRGKRLARPVSPRTAPTTVTVST
ncbi:formate/nitrite transporter family protein [Kocuria rhizophila]|nr:formate/nitrite transporter family protein [Kocuria rhizophila]